MNSLKQFILEKFKLSSKNIKNQYYEFEDDGLDENIQISLPFRIVLPDHNEYEEVYKIEKHEINKSGRPYWKFFDDKGNIITSFGLGGIIALIQKKNRVWAVIMNLHGKPYNKSETIYIHKSDL